MENNTWIKSYRKMIEWEWYKDIPVNILFNHLLRTVNYQTKRWQGVEIQKGERVTSVGILAEETGLSAMQVRTAMNKLILTKEITKSSTSTFTLIQVQNWTQYQDEVTRCVTNEQQTDNKRVTTTKESKERKEDTTTLISVLDFFNNTTGAKLKLTDNKKKQIRKRLETFSIEELQIAIQNRMKSQWHIDNGWIKDWDSLFCNDDKIDKMLNIGAEAPTKKVRPTFNFLTGEAISYND